MSALTPEPYGATASLAPVKGRRRGQPGVHGRHHRPTWGLCAGWVLVAACSGDAAAPTDATGQSVLTSAGSTNAASTTTSSTTTTMAPTTTVYVPPAPAALVAPYESPRAGEGQWTPLVRAGGMDAMWVTQLRPLPNASKITATVVVIDQTYLRVAMFNGYTVAGDWARDSTVPTDLWPSMLVAMNGGFKLEQSNGGYVTEGTVVQPLINGRATMAIDRDGMLHIGELGRDIFDDGTWASLRQNLNLLVDAAQPQLQRARRERVYWGSELGGNDFVPRTALCELADGRLAYMMASPVDAGQLADALIRIGCVTAIQLDINTAWPSFNVMQHMPDGTLVQQPVDSRMSRHQTRYLTDGAAKDFFAFFDASSLPATSALDT